MSPIVKKAIAALAIKEGFDRIQESRRPQKPSLLGRLFKLSLIGGVGYGVYYAYKNGLFGSLGSKSDYDRYDGQVSVQRPLDTPSDATDPVGAPNA